MDFAPDYSIVKEDSIVYYELSNHGELTYYEESGGNSYNNYGLDTNKEGDKIFSKEQIIEVGKKFLNNFEIVDKNNFKFSDIYVSLSEVDAKNRESIQEYQVVFMRKLPESLSEYDSVGLGFKINIDIYGNITSFKYTDKKLEVVEGSYPSKDSEEVIEDIEDGSNVLVNSNDNVEGYIKYSNIKLILYSDSNTMEQKYLIPCYQLETKDKTKNVIVPAIKNKYLKVE